MNRVSMRRQLKQLWNNVRALGVKHEYKSHIIRGENFMNNHTWLKKLNAIELMQTLGSGMRLGTMLNRDSYVPILYLAYNPKYVLIQIV